MEKRKYNPYLTWAIMLLGIVFLVVLALLLYHLDSHAMGIARTVSGDTKLQMSGGQFDIPGAIIALVGVLIMILGPKKRKWPLFIGLGFLFLALLVILAGYFLAGLQPSNMNFFKNSTVQTNLTGALGLILGSHFLMPLWLSREMLIKYITKVTIIYKIAFLAGHTATWGSISAILIILNIVGIVSSTWAAVSFAILFVVGNFWFYIWTQPRIE